MICPRCGTENLETAETCKQCQYPFSHYHNFGDFSKRAFPMIPILADEGKNKS